MKVLPNTIPLLTVIRKLAMDHLTGGEILFLCRRVRYTDDTECWINLANIYGQDEVVLRRIEKTILLRLSFDGLMQVEDWLNGWAGDDYINRLTPTERANLRMLVEEALTLHSETVDWKAPRPESAPLLAGDEKEQLALLVESDLAHQPTKVQPGRVNQATSRPAAKLHALPVQSGRKPPASNGSKTSHTDPILSDCPYVIVSGVARPEQFLEGMFRLHLWLNETIRTVSDLRQFVAQQWRPLNDTHFQKALETFYALGVMAPLTFESRNTLIQPTLASNLTVSQFRRACAEKFTQRIQNNPLLLATIDHFDCASFDYLKRKVFGDTLITDLSFRLTIWEALGIVHEQRKDYWKITQAGRALVAALPRVQVIIPEIAEPMPMTTDTDWLDVL